MSGFLDYPRAGETDHALGLSNNNVAQSRAVVVFLESIFIGDHSLKTQDVHGFQIGIHFYKRVRVEQILNPLFSWLRKVIVAARTDALILRKLNFRHDFRTAGALLKKTTRNVPLSAALRLNCWLLENCHETYARAAVAA